MSDSNVENATKIQNEIEALRRLAATVPNDPLAQASIAGQINALEWARGKSGPYSRMNDDTNDENSANARFMGASDLWRTLDRLAQATLHVTASDFVADYPSGRFDRSPIARDLAKLIPFVSPTFIGDNSRTQG